MPKYNLSGANIFNSAIGDNAFVVNILQNSDQIQSHIHSLRDQIGKYDDERTRDYLNSLIEDLSKQLDRKNQDKAQQVWNQIKEGIKTAGAGTTIVMALGKLLGFLP